MNTFLELVLAVIFCGVIVLIINNLYKVLRSNGGTLLIELAEEYDGSKFTNKEIQKWLQQLNEQGIETKNSWKIVRLTRTNQSPANLPIN